jgi:hypothetical protein
MFEKLLFHSSLKHFLDLYISNKHVCCYTATDMSLSSTPDITR